MKFTIDKRILTEAVGNLQRAVSTKTSIPALEGILIRTDVEKIILSAYDLEIGMQTELPAVISAPGAIILTARLFSEIVRKSPADDVTVESGRPQHRDDHLRRQLLHDHRHERRRIPGIPEDHRHRHAAACPPECVEKHDPPDAFRHRGLEPRSRSTRAACLKLKTEHARRRLRRRLPPRPAPRSDPFRRNDTRLCRSWKDTFRSAQAPSATTTARSRSARAAGIFCSKSTITPCISALLEGEFLDYRAALPKDKKTEVAVSTRTLIDSVERVSLLITDRLKSPVRCVFNEDTVKLLCSTTMGRAERPDFEAKITGDPLEIGFNNKYLLDALRAAEMRRSAAGARRADQPDARPAEGGRQRSRSSSCRSACAAKCIVSHLPHRGQI